VKESSTKIRMIKGGWESNCPMGHGNCVGFNVADWSRILLKGERFVGEKDHSVRTAFIGLNPDDQPLDLSSPMDQHGSVSKPMESPVVHIKIAGTQ
jgi:hypothetical protein